MKPNANNIRRGLERRYANGWRVLHEVSNHLGWMQDKRSAKENGGVSKRKLDTIAIGMFRSTKYAIVGHEIKVSRADFLAELREPENARAFDDLVNEFYLVAPKGVVKKTDHLPYGWGLLTWYPTRIVVTRPPIARDFSSIPRSFSSSPSRTASPMRAAIPPSPRLATKVWSGLNARTQPSRVLALPLLMVVSRVHKVSGRSSVADPACWFVSVEAEYNPLAVNHVHAVSILGMHDLGNPLSRQRVFVGRVR